MNWEETHMLTLDEATSRCWAEVDLSRLRENYHNALKHLRGGVRVHDSDHQAAGGQSVYLEKLLSVGLTSD